MTTAVADRQRQAWDAYDQHVRPARILYLDELERIKRSKLNMAEARAARLEACRRFLAVVREGHLEYCSRVKSS